MRYTLTQSKNTSIALATALDYEDSREATRGSDNRRR